jgi:hypothetical protein
MQAAVRALRAAKLAYAGLHSQAMSQAWTRGQDMYFKKSALEHLTTLAGECDDEIDAPTKKAVRVLSVATVVRCAACIKASSPNPAVYVCT